MTPTEGPHTQRQARGPRVHLRHDAARRRAVARHLAERAGEARDRAPARAPGRRHHRGRLPDHLARRLRGRDRDREGGRGAGDLRPRAHVGAGHRRRLERGQALRAAAHPHLHRDLRHPHRAQAADDARGRDRPGTRGRRAREGVLRRRRVLARGRQPLRRRVHGRGREGGDRGGRDHDQHPRHGRLHDAARVRADLRGPVPAGARAEGRRGLGPLPRRPGHGGRQLVRRAARRARGRWSAP